MNLSAMLSDLAAIPAIPSCSMWELLVRFSFNVILVQLIIHFFYYPKGRRRDFYFTFSLINVSVFMLIFLLGNIDLKIGFALGVFGIFSIVRYRTETVPIREMTYLFLIITISVINALSIQISWTVLLVANSLMVLIVALMESERWLTHTGCKLVRYDKIALITPDKREELIADLAQRTGLPITRVEVGHIDFLSDATMLKVYYQSDSRDPNSVDKLVKLPNGEGI
jgi:Zn-dependent protease with chaperone function